MPEDNRRIELAWQRAELDRRILAGEVMQAWLRRGDIPLSGLIKDLEYANREVGRWN